MFHEPLDAGLAGIFTSLVGVKDLGRPSSTSKCFLKYIHHESARMVEPDLPSEDFSGKGIHDRGEVDMPSVKPEVREIPGPDRIWLGLGKLLHTVRDAFHRITIGFFIPKPVSFHFGTNAILPHDPEDRFLVGFKVGGQASMAIRRVAIEREENLVSERAILIRSTKVVVHGLTSHAEEACLMRYGCHSE